MLDKVVLQYSKNGVVERNLATDEFRLVAKSDYGKESKLEIPAQESQYNSPYSLPVRAVNLHSKTPTHLKLGSPIKSPQVARKPYSANTVYRLSHQPRILGYRIAKGNTGRAMEYHSTRLWQGSSISRRHTECGSPINDKTNAAIVPTHDRQNNRLTDTCQEEAFIGFSSKTDAALMQDCGNRDIRSSDVYQEEGYIGFGETGEITFLPSGDRKGFQEENALPGMKGTPIPLKNNKGNFQSKYYFLRKLVRKLNRGQGGAKDEEDNLGIQTVKTITRTSDRLLHRIQQIKKFSHFITRHPALAKFLLAVAGVFFGIILLSVLFCALGGGTFGGATEHPELTTYVQQLDLDFINRINSVTASYSQKGYTVSIEGDESLSTDSSALAILATQDWTNIDLTPQNKAKLAQCHNLLNYYTVSTYDEIKTDGKSQTTIHHAVILIHSCTAEERIDAFGFSPGVKAHVLEMLGVLRQIESETGSGTVKGGSVSATVLAYQSLINQYCTQYGISGYESLVLAVMQQESGGTGKDPMQASECGFNTRFPNVPNGITDPNYSIQCGVEDLASCLRAARCKSPNDISDISLALQGYNFGNGYIAWAQQRGGYSQANAVIFSQMEAKKTGMSGYGDVNYVNHVLRYYNAIQNGGNFIWPVTGHTDISSGYGPRIDPISKKEGAFHQGVDIPAPTGTPIHAAASGTVVYAQFGSAPYGGYGNLVIIRHSNSLVTMYGHCSKLLVTVGQTVQQGQEIALVGSTGKATGPHCHFEIRVNGVHTNPLPYLQSKAGK